MFNLCITKHEEMRLNLSDETINSYGFWVKTDGIDMSRFKKNPIMLFNHHRTCQGTTNEVLPIGRWENIAIENGVLKADAVFDETDGFALKIKNKVENGFLKGCSIGIKPLEYSEDPSVLKPGQKAMTITKCELMEVSIVDIPSNPNASDVVLYAQDDSIINLSAGGTLPENLKLNFLNMNIALKLGLPEKASEQECLSAIEALQAYIKEASELKALNEQLTAKVADFEKKKAEALKAEAANIIDLAVKAGKIDAKAKEQFEKLFANDFANAKSILDAIPERKSMNAAINHCGSGLETLSWDELDKAGRLAELKEKDLETFKTKYKEKFNVEYN
jgi:Caudovirus prohead protease.